MEGIAIGSFIIMTLLPFGGAIAEIIKTKKGARK